MQKHRENTRKYAFGGVLMFVLLGALAAPRSAGAQTPFVTPTPLPAIQATQQAAQARAAEAQAGRQQAAQMRAQADEIQRNADAQQSQAAQAWSDASAAAAAQNAAAFGEAIGRGQAALDQLRASVAGQAAIVATLTARADAQAGTIISLTNELQQARIDIQTTLAAYTVVKAQQAEHQNDSLIGNIVVLFVFIVISVLLVSLLWFVISRRAERVTIVDSVRAASAAPGVDERSIDGDFSPVGYEPDEQTKP